MRVKLSTYLFLWLVNELLRQFHDRFHLELDERQVSDVVDWFAEVVSEQDEIVRKELELKTEAEAGAKVAWFGLRLGVLAKLQSMIRGSHEKRRQIRQTLQRYSSDLIGRTNLLLDHAQDVLRKAGRPGGLLIVIDNLDRLTFDVSESLFFQNGDLLRSLRAHMIYTVPVAIALSPRNIRMVFSKTYTLPMVKTQHANGRPYTPGVKALKELVALRVDAQLFASPSPVGYLAKMSGGSVRDLMRLLGYAANVARADGHDKINQAAAREAVKDMRLDFERLLIPGQLYYPLLARVHATKRDWFGEAETLSPEKLQTYQHIFRTLLFNGVVLEYNGNDNWYDVHPVILEIDEFRAALKSIQKPAEPTNDVQS